MDHHTAREIVACLDGQRIVYPYYRDRYGIGLLHHLSRQAADHQPLSVAALKRSPYAPLLQKPRVKTVLAQLGHDRLDEPYLAAHDHDPEQQYFVLTLGTWGSDSRSQRFYRQTSRPGHNLALQLNFSREHDRQYGRLGGEHSALNYRSHPISPSRNTLAWARIDLDWASNSALIEEIQSDWIRRAAWLAESVERRLRNGLSPMDPIRMYGLTCPMWTAQTYCRYVQERYGAIWAEAMLWAAILFIRDTLGLRHVYYHGEASNRLLKGFKKDYAPPRSLYTDLPRKFCLTPTEEVPEFLLEDRHVQRVLRRNPGVGFFRLMH